MSSGGVSQAGGFFSPCQAGVCEISMGSVWEDTPPGLQGWEQAGTHCPGPHLMVTKATGLKTRKGLCGGERLCQVRCVACPPGYTATSRSLRPPSSPSASRETLALGPSGNTGSPLRWPQEWSSQLTHLQGQGPPHVKPRCF